MSKIARHDHSVKCKGVFGDMLTEKNAAQRGALCGVTCLGD